jgi:two-component system, chemotaxis family, protein-glutamate methylesterase/glutaminase
MSGRDIIVVGASAGGVEALVKLASHLPADLPAALLVVLHLPSRSTSVLPKILSRVGPLKAIHPQHNDPIQRGYIYIAPPDHHLLIKGEVIHLSRGPRENGHRPAIDPLFRSAARTYGPQVVGVILSGALDDGTAGLQAVKMRNGIAVVQDPTECPFPGMPQSAIEKLDVDYVLLVTEIAVLLDQLAHQELPADASPASAQMEDEIQIAELDMNAVEDENRPGTPSMFACPDCGGTLWEIHDGELVHFRCRVGHAFSAETLLAEQSEALEEALWVAFRALEESASLATRMAKKADHQGHNLTAQRYYEQAEDTRQRAALIRQALLSGTPVDNVESAVQESNPIKFEADSE